MLTNWNNDEVSVKESPPWGAGVPQYTDMSAPLYFCMPELLITNYKKWNYLTAPKSLLEWVEFIKS